VTGHLARNLLVRSAQLARAVTAVRGELRVVGAWDDRLASVEVVLTPVGYPHGWQEYGGLGRVVIPRVSACRLWDALRGHPLPLRALLRHELAHAVADTHRGLIRSRRFTRAFGAPHERPGSVPFDPEHHWTPYSATDAGECFAEMFRLYLARLGRPPTRPLPAGQQRRWNFVADLCEQIRHGRRRWSWAAGGPRGLPAALHAPLALRVPPGARRRHGGAAGQSRKGHALVCLRTLSQEPRVALTPLPRLA